MINLKSLTLKNFLSIGNQTQALDLTKEELTLVLGENLDSGSGTVLRNGAGKSSILNAISYALYGLAVTNIRKDNLINTINKKNMLVTLTFEKNGIEYRIERGRKPNVLKFFVNNVEQDNKETDDAQGDARETQKDLDLLLGMSHDMFKHIVALNTYTEPFLSMRANDQRAIIEQLLGVTLLSEKADQLKEQIKLTKDQVYQATADIEAAKKSNERIQQSIDTLASRQRAWLSQRDRDVEKLANSIVELESLNIEAELIAHTELKEYLDRRAKVASLNKQKATLESAAGQAEKTLAKYKRDLESLSLRKCHACDQELQDHKHSELTDLANKQVEDAASYLNKISDELAKIQEEISQHGEDRIMPETFYESVEQALTHQNNLASLQQQLEIKATEEDPYQHQIDDLKDTALQEIVWDQVNELNRVKDHQEFLLKLLTNKDSFIRKKIIDQNLSYLNTRLGYYLDKLGLPHNVKFQNDLTVEITQLGQSLDFDNLSRGERTRLILSLSFSFRDVWESLFQPINLLFIDELVDNGLDSAGVEAALAVLKKMGRERNKNVFLISHRDELVGRVSSVLKVVKENGFSSLSNDVEISGT